MKLDKEKISSKGYFRIGFDKYSGNYLMETDDTFGNNRYFIISEEQYKWFDIEPNKLEFLYNKFVKENIQSEVFYFSNWEKENSDEQNELMWKYIYIDMLVGKTKEEIRQKIGMPNKVLDEGRIEIFKMSSNLQITVVYSNTVCLDVL